MKRFILVLFVFSLCALGFSQESVFLSGWIKSDLVVKQGSKDKVKQALHADSKSGNEANVWLESSNGWVKLHFSAQQLSKKQSPSHIEEALPIYDQGNVLWEKEKLHRLDGPAYNFEFKIFSIEDSPIPEKDIRISLYYRWTIDGPMMPDKK